MVKRSNRVTASNMYTQTTCQHVPQYVQENINYREFFTDSSNLADISMVCSISKFYQ